MSVGESIFVLAVAVIEVYYWFFWFPKAYKNGSTREIRDIKQVVASFKKPS